MAGGEPGPAGAELQARGPAGGGGTGTRQIRKGRSRLARQLPCSTSPCCSEGLKFTVCAKILQEINARKKKEQKKKKKQKPVQAQQQQRRRLPTPGIESPGRQERKARRGGSAARGTLNRRRRPAAPRPRARARPRPAPAPGSVTQLQLPERARVPAAPPGPPPRPPLTCSGRR